MSFHLEETRKIFDILSAMKQGHSLLLLTLLAGTPTPLHAAPSPRCVTVVGTNDLHGAIAPYELKQKGKILKKSGVVAQSGYIHRVREVFGEQVLLLDGGDLFQGTMASNLSRGKAVIDAYNQMGYTASAIGNHEFDFGAVTPKARDRLGVLKNRLAQAEFPFLAANIFDTRTGKLVDWPNTQPTLLIQRGDVKVGVIGISTPQTPQTTRFQNVSDLEFRAPLPIVTDYAKRLRAQGADLIILLTHMGDNCRNFQGPDDIQSCNGSGELFTLINDLPHGTIDIAIGGHTHGYIAHWVNNVATIESGGHGRHMGMVKACLDKNNKFDRQRSRIYPPTELCIDAWTTGGCGFNRSPTQLTVPVFLGAPVQPTDSMRALMAPYLQQVYVKKATPVGVNLPHALKRKAPGRKSLGYLVASAAREELKADVGIQNRGGVRADLPDGLLNYGMVFEVLPFGNNLTLMKLTGRQLKTFIKHLSARRNGTLPYIAGISARTKRGNLILSEPNGTLIAPDKRYRVATTDFLASGGEGLGELLAPLTGDQNKVQNVKLRTALINLLKRRFPATP